MNKLTLSRKPVRLLAILTLVFVFLSVPIISPLQFAFGQNNQTQYYVKEFAWDYNGHHWTWNLSIPTALYEAYKSVPVSTRTRNGPEGYGYMTTTKDYYMQMLAQKLNDTATAQGYNSFDEVSYVLAFVQSLTYTSDNVTEGYNEYPRFPIETLVDDGGDCEDTAILFATLTLILGFGTVYINPPDHYAVGILGGEGLSGTYWTYPTDSTNKYYYCETTGDGFTIGQLPDEFKGQSAYIYSIDQSNQYVPSIAIVTPTPLQTNSPFDTATPTGQTTATPTIGDPTTQPVLPIGLNLITENPVLFTVILLAIIVSITLAVISVRKPKQTPLYYQSPSTPESAAPTFAPSNTLGGDKFCIYCGSVNKSFAMYCEKCGKKIG
jgi:hypothetical protein